MSSEEWFAEFAPKGTRNSDIHNADIAHKEHQRVARERRTESSWKPLKQRYVTLMLQLLSGKRIAQKEKASESLSVWMAQREVARRHDSSLAATTPHTAHLAYLGAMITEINPS